MNNLQKSLEFYITARLALSERVEKNPFLIEAEKKVTKNFLQNEASDYQIMELLVNNEYVEEKLDPNKEVDLFEKVAGYPLVPSLFGYSSKFTFFEQWEGKPKGWSKKSMKSYWKSLTGDRKKKVTACIKKMKGDVDDPEAFCASLAREVGHK